MAWENRGNNGNRNSGGGNYNGGNRGGGGGGYNRGGNGYSNNRGSGGQGGYPQRNGQGGGGNYQNNQGSNKPRQSNQDIPQIVGTNRALIVGYIESFDMKYTPQGLAIFNAKVAIPFPMGKNGEWAKSSFNVVAFEKLADDIGNTVQEGTWVKIIGQMRNRGYKDQNGDMKWTFQINIEKFEFVDPNNNMAVISRPTSGNNAPDHNDDAPRRAPVRNSGNQDGVDKDLAGLREIEDDPDPDA